MLAGSRIERRAVRIERPVRQAGDGACDIAARAKAGIKQSRLLQLFARKLVIGEMLRLATYRHLPFKAQPYEILKDRGLELWP
jgi:hypothetical protein